MLYISNFGANKRLFIQETSTSLYKNGTLWFKSLLNFSFLLTGLMTNRGYCDAHTRAMLENIEHWDTIEAVAPHGKYLDLSVAPDGALWISDIVGIHRYDGVTTQRFAYPDNPKAKRIVFIETTRNNDTYAVSYRNVYKLVDNNWQHIGETQTPESERGIESSDGSIWFATDTQLVRIKDRTVQHFPTPAKKITDVLIDHLGYLWVVDRITSSVYQFRFHNNRIKQKNYWPSVGHKFSGKSLSTPHLAQTQDKRIWFISRVATIAPHYLDYDTSNQWREAHALDPFESGRDDSIAAGPNNSLFILRSGKLLYYSENKWTEHPHPFNANLSSGRRNELIITPDLSLIAFDPFLGIKRLDLSQNVWQIFEDRIFQCATANGEQLFITHAGNILTRKTNGHEKMLKRGGDIIETPVEITCADNNDIWVTGADNGQAAASRRHNGVWQKISLEKLGISVSRDAFTIDKQGKAYFGGDPGAPPAKAHTLATWHPDTGINYLTQKTQPAITRIFSRKNGRFIFQRWRNHFFETHDFKHPKKMKKPHHYGNYKMVEDGLGKLWLASWGRGIFHRSRDISWSHDFQNLQAIHHLTGLVGLERGGAMGLTPVGLVKATENQLLITKTKAIKQRRNGNEIIESADSAIWVNMAGDSWYRRYRYPALAASIKLRSVRIKNNYLAPNTFFNGKGVTLSPFDKTQRLEFSAIDTWSETPTHTLQYSYKIDQARWSSFTSENFLYLNALDPGTHTIQMRSRDDFGNIDNTPVSLSITIPKAFWQTLGFRLAITTLFISLMAAISYIYWQRLKNITQLETMRISFLTRVSHELRSPLTMILDPLQSIRKTIHDECQKKQVDTALRSAYRMNELVSQLLDYRKTQLNQTRLNPSRHDLVAFHRVLTGDLSQVAQLRQQSIQFNTDRHTYLCQFDQDALRKIVENLLTNALNYSPDRARVDVTLSTQHANGIITLTITDEGIGINPKIQKQIFDPFHTAASPIGDRESFGVGLALVKELVDAMNGHIRIHSPVKKDTDGFVGSQFIVSLPLAETQEDNPSGHTVNVIGNPANHRILIVDDQKELLEYLREVLIKDYQVFVSTQPREALKIATELIPDIIISDVVMPDMTGVELCEALKNQRETAHIPVILQSAASDRETLSLKSGAMDFITKPISLEVLSVKLRNHFEQRKYLTEHVKQSLLVGSIGEQSQDSAFLKKVKKVFDENISDPEFKVETIANKFSISRSSFYRKFDAIVGTSPNDFFRTYRLEKAAILLKSGKKVSEVATQVGYSEASSFSRSFKAHFGITPSKCKSSCELG